MPLTQAEFEALLADKSKTISGDVEWKDDEDRSPAVEFRVEVESDAGYPLMVCGSYNALAKAATFALVHRGVGRIYALDIGKDHHNPECNHTGDIHKHHWTEQFRDKQAYVPNDITATIDDVVGLWEDFCAEAKITHHGEMKRPPLAQEFL